MAEHPQGGKVSAVRLTYKWIDIHIYTQHKDEIK